MAKQVYKIPYTIDNIRLRALVSLKVNNVGPKNQVYIYQVLGWLAVILGTAALIYWSPIKYALVWAIPIVISAFFLGFVALRTQSNGLPGYRWIKPTFTYMVSRKDRYFKALKTTGTTLRKSRSGRYDVAFSPELQKIRTLTDIDAVSGDGRISFRNGDVGVLFRISGFTSLVILDQELEQVIDAINKWFNALDPQTGWVLITDHSSQRVVNQQKALVDALKMWQARGGAPAPIKELIRERNNELKLVKKRYKSSQQYLMLRTKDLELLDKEISQLSSSTRAGMLKSLEMMSSDDTLKVLRSVMYGDDH